MDKEIIKIYISQPMSFKSDKEVVKELVEAVTMAKIRMFGPTFGEFEPEVEVLNTTSDANEYDYAHASPLYFLGNSIQMMGQADVIVFAKGWMEDRNCRIERKVSYEYRLKVIDLDVEG